MFEEIKENSIRLFVNPDGSTRQEIARKNLKTKKIDWMALSRR